MEEFHRLNAGYDAPDSGFRAGERQAPAIDLVSNFGKTAEAAAAMAATNQNPAILSLAQEQLASTKSVAAALANLASNWARTPVRVEARFS